MVIRGSWVALILIGVIGGLLGIFTTILVFHSVHDTHWKWTSRGLSLASRLASGFLFIGRFWEWPSSNSDLCHTTILIFHHPPCPLLPHNNIMLHLGRGRGGNRNSYANADTIPLLQQLQSRSQWQECSCDMVRMRMRCCEVRGVTERRYKMQVHWIVVVQGEGTRNRG